MVYKNSSVSLIYEGTFKIQRHEVPLIWIFSQYWDLDMRNANLNITGKYIYAINGPTSSLLPVQGLTIDPEAETVIDHWAPEEVRSSF